MGTEPGPLGPQPDALPTEPNRVGLGGWFLHKKPAILDAICGAGVGHPREELGPGWVQVGADQPWTPTGLRLREGKLANGHSLGACNPSLSWQRGQKGKKKEVEEEWVSFWLQLGSKVRFQGRSKGCSVRRKPASGQGRALCLVNKNHLPALCFLLSREAFHYHSEACLLKTWVWYYCFCVLALAAQLRAGSGETG